MLRLLDNPPALLALLAFLALVVLAVYIPVRLVRSSRRRRQ